MANSVTRLRRWFAGAAILMIAIVVGMYSYARWRVSRAVHELPPKIGLNIQQSAEGFSISKSEQGRTIFTVSASKAIQLKESGRAQLHNVKIVVYGKDSSRFDRISGDDFEFDPKSGDVTSKGRVLIDLQANPEGIRNSDQTPPPENRKPIHLESDGLTFNKDSGNASSSGKVVFETPDAVGSAVGVNYVSKTGTMTLRSAVEMTVSRPRQFHLVAEHGVITKQPSEVVLDTVHLTREGQKLKSEQATFFLRPDDTIERILAEGNVEAEIEGSSEIRERSDRADLKLTGSRNQLTLAVLSGHVHLETSGAQPSEGDAGQATLYFGTNQVLEKVHAEEGVHLSQNRSAQSPQAAGGQAAAGGVNASAAAQSVPPAPKGSGLQTGPQQVEMKAPIMDFTVANGNQLQLAETTGPPEILITQPETKQRTVVTADRFTAKFTEQNRLNSLHGEPNSRIVSSAPGQPDRISTSPKLDVLFGTQGDVSTITQSSGLTYVSGTQKAWAQRGTYTAADEMFVLVGSPRVVDSGMTTTAQTIRFNRTSGDAFADGNVKSTYSDLKAQPDGAMLASSDPIHVVSRSMTAHRSSNVAVYSGNARLWQDSNVVEAPTLEFNHIQRSLVAEGNADQSVKTVVVQIDNKTGQATPVTITSARLTYNDAARKIFLNGDVMARGSDGTMTARQMTVYLLARSQSQAASPASTIPGAGQVDKIIAENSVVLTQPTRRATGDRLVYTATDEKYDLTGGPPSIFDAERGKITGDSLTFYKRDDRVLVEGRDTSRAITRTQVAR
jgi:lipopolysaccharide export system protein LptA